MLSDTPINPSIAEWIAAFVAGVPAAIIADLVRPYLFAFLGLAWWEMRRWWISIRVWKNLSSVMLVSA